MLRASCLSAALLLLVTTGCDIGKVTVNTTSKVLVRASPSLEQEADYDLAARAIPGTLKTIEGFHYVDNENPRLKGLLAQGYCQYASGFIEDEYELADIAGDHAGKEHQAGRATKANFRCMNYALELLGDGWKQAILGDVEAVRKKAAGVEAGATRDALMWVAIGLGGAINFNRDDVGLISQVPKVRVLLERVVAIDDAHGHERPNMRALPHLALAMMYSSTSAALGGKPEVAAAEFKRALELTDGKFLLAKVYFARRIAVGKQDRKLFRDTLLEVLETDPAIWPEQRLANEIAHRRARRYLTREKEWF